MQHPKVSDNDKHWGDGGQCVVIEDHLMAAAHARIYDNNQYAREVAKKSKIQELKLKSSDDSDSEDEVEIRALASEHARKTFPPDYLPFSSFRAVFQPPISGPYIDKSRPERQFFICELIRHSATMDIAILRIDTVSVST